MIDCPEKLSRAGTSLYLLRAGRRPLNQGGRGALSFLPFCPDDVHLSCNCNPQHPMKRCTRMKKSPEKKQTKESYRDGLSDLPCGYWLRYAFLFHFCAVGDVAWRGT
jgi:hypothetical protein